MSKLLVGLCSFAFSYFILKRAMRLALDRTALRFDTQVDSRIAFKDAKCASLAHNL